MDQRELTEILDGLLKLPKETEWFACKEAKTSFGLDDIGKYFSALCNEANLKRQIWRNSCAIGCFGVDGG